MYQQHTDVYDDIIYIKDPAMADVEKHLDIGPQAVS